MAQVIVALRQLICKSKHTGHTRLKIQGHRVFLRPLKREFSSSPHPSESFLIGANAVYVKEMYNAWKNSPESVHKSWDVYFRQVDRGAVPGAAFVPPPTLQGGTEPVNRPSAVGRGTNDALGLSYLIHAYQMSGHEAAKLDPLGLHEPPDLEELKIEHYGFSKADMSRKVEIPSNFASGVTGFLKELTGTTPTLCEIVNRLKETYCRSIGVEYMHIRDRRKCNWIRTHVESMVSDQTTREKKLHTLERLAYADTFEKFLGNKYNTTKRFGLDGAETLIPGMKAMVDRSTELGVENIVFGMPHRGRLNVLSNVIRKPIYQIFKEFQGTHFDLDAYNAGIENNDWSSSGDVKYHLGTSFDRTYPDGRTVHLSLVANPSHLEAVNPVVMGKVRAKQFYLGNNEESMHKVMPVLLHGDAAFCGQGVVYETMHFTELENYHTGGTIHVVVNNQIGFTTDPKSSRSSTYSTDVGKALEIPIFHVNGDDPEAVVKVFELAAEWRQAWKTDVIIDLVCYRKFGHNEIDNPMYTQPLMYKKIDSMKSALQLYAESLTRSGVATKQEIDAKLNSVHEFFQKSFEESQHYESQANDWLANQWDSFKSPTQQSRIRKTGVNIDTLKLIGDHISCAPEGFKVHRQLMKILNAKKKTVDTGEGIDWGTAETLAWGALLLEGNHVRISGQDVQRGTFSHRHAVLHCQDGGDTYTPLNHLVSATSPSASLKAPEEGRVQAEFVASNSSLSEFGVLGFELGYSLENPNALVMWEAQFGDFANGAQIVIDQFISAGEDKWMRQSGITLLLPHGYEGQGSEHSSCRVERFLQMVNEDPDTVPAMDPDERMQIQRTNWQVVYCSTPAQYFHVLRRQIHRDFRKPLISVQPKHLLRLKQASSKLEDMAEGTKFQRVIPEMESSLVSDDKIRRLVLCTGKIYYELVNARKEKGCNDVALVRIEQIAPFPFDKVAEQAAKYSNAQIVWSQEEPKNMGFWAHVQPRIETSCRELLKDTRRPSYAGRECSAAVATGYGALSLVEQERILEQTLA